MQRRGLSENELSRRTNVPQPTINRIVTGKSRDPRRATLQPLLAYLFGERPAISNVEPGPDLARYGEIPLISWVHAGWGNEAVDLLQPGDAEEWLRCPVGHSDHTYALRVRGDSMEPDYSEGDIVYVDPMIPPEHRKTVVVRTSEEEEVTLKQLVFEGERRYLKALNPHYPEPVRIVTEEDLFCGVVIGKFTPA